MNAIEVRNLSKKFSRSHRRMMLYAALDIGRSVLGLDRKSGVLRDKEFWALDEINLSLTPGARLGLIGRNGSGKSTLLKILNGIMHPDKGSVTIRGRMGALIEVGAGFHPMLTGRENIYVNAAILGMKRQEIDRKFDEMVNFAEIGEFLDSPVKFYSSGMFVRLGFSVAIHSEPDILLIDEVLAVGDQAFRAKCFDRIETMIEKGTTVILVSHSMAAIQRICPQSLVLDRGKPRFFGDTLNATAAYYGLLQGVSPEALAEGQVLRVVHRDGDQTVRVEEFDVFDDTSESVTRVVAGSQVRFSLKIKDERQRRDRLPHVAVRLIDPKTDELIANIQTPEKFISDAGNHGDFRLECSLAAFNPSPGLYELEVKIGGDGTPLCDVAAIRPVLEVCWSKEVVDNISYKGRLYFPGDWSIGNCSSGE